MKTRRVSATASVEGLSRAARWLELPQGDLRVTIHAIDPAIRFTPPV